MSEINLPHPDFARRKGWRWQVSWTQDGKPCFSRLQSRDEAERWIDDLSANPKISDLAMRSIPWSDA